MINRFSARSSAAVSRLLSRPSTLSCSAHVFRLTTQYRPSDHKTILPIAIALPSFQSHLSSLATFSSSTTSVSDSTPMSSEDKKDLTGVRVAICVEYNYEDAELIYPLHRLREEGATVFTVGFEKGKQYSGKHGYPCKADRSIDDVTSSDIDCLIIPGGFAPDYWRRSDKYKKLTKDALEEGKPVAAICHGPWLLVSAGVLKGKKATCFHAIKDDVANAGATYVEGEPVVVDGNLITSRTPDDLGEFCKAIIKQLKAKL